MALSPFSLEEIFNLDPTYINDLLTLNHWHLQSPLTNKLSATILLHNGAFLIPQDNKYIQNISFSTLYLYKNNILIQIAQNFQLDYNIDKIKLIRIIIDKLDSYNQEEKDQALITAAKNGHTQTVQLLLDNGADIHTKDGDALIKAAKNGHTQTVRVLLDYGANVHADQEDALRLAAQNGHTQTVQVLLNYEANVHVYGDEPLILAAEKGHKETVKLLLENDADVHAEDDEALRNAAKKGHTETVKILLDNDANVHAKDDKALRRAVAGGHTETVKLLLENGADFNKLSSELQNKYRYLLPK